MYKRIIHISLCIYGGSIVVLSAKKEPLKLNNLFIKLKMICAYIVTKYLA